MGLPDQAMEAYRQAIERQPQFATAHFNLGLMLRRQDKKAEAAVEFQKVLDAAPFRLLGETDELFSEAHFYLADEAYDRRDWETAATHYRAALRLDPVTRAGQLQYNLAQVLMESGRHDEARQQFEAAIDPLRQQTTKEPGDALLWFALGRSLFENNRLAEAVEPLSRANALRPDDPLTISQLSQSLIATRQYEQAINLLTRSLHLSYPFIRNRLTLLLASVPQEHLRESTRALRLAMELCPSPPNCSPRYLDTIGVVMAEMGRFEEAKRFAGKATEMLSQSSSPADQALLIEAKDRYGGYKRELAFRLPE
jgi:tetratricopeptide (TPR) repeat protein